MKDSKLPTPSRAGLDHPAGQPPQKPEFMDHEKSMAFVKSMAFGLMFQCPMGEAEEACVFKEMRKVKQTRDGKLIYQAIYSRSTEELEEMVGRHRACLQEREGEGKNNGRIFRR